MFMLISERRRQRDNPRDDYKPNMNADRGRPRCMACVAQYEGGTEGSARSEHLRFNKNARNRLQKFNEAAGSKVVGRLRRALYGTRGAPMSWSDHLGDTMEGIGC